MLRDYSEACGGRVRKYRIYAVLARPLRRAGTEVIREVRDVSAQNARLHLSPLFDSSQSGLVNIALLPGYFQHDGPKTEKMLLALGRVTCFAPLMTNLYRFLEGEEITGLNVIPLTAALHTVFMYLPPIKARVIKHSADEKERQRWKTKSKGNRHWIGMKSQPKSE
jgi:hypothetical protein